MLREQTKNYISGLSDEELVEYALTGSRQYEPEAVAYAKSELARRGLSAERVQELRRPVEMKLAVEDAGASALEPAVVGQSRRRSQAILCAGCGLEAEIRYVEYHQNIGALLVRFSRVYRGQMCGRCNRSFFWRATLITLFLGWWGVTSLFMTVVYLVANTITVLRTLRVPAPPAGATRPAFDDGVVTRIAPLANKIVERLIERVDANDIAREVAPEAGVTPGQAVLYVYELRRRRAEGALEV